MWEFLTGLYDNSWLESGVNFIADSYDGSMLESGVDVFYDFDGDSGGGLLGGGGDSDWGFGAAYDGSMLESGVNSLFGIGDSEVSDFSSDNSILGQSTLNDAGKSFYGVSDSFASNTSADDWDWNFVDLFSDEDKMTAYGNAAKGVGGLVTGVAGIYDAKKQRDYLKAKDKEEREWRNQLYADSREDKEWDKQYARDKLNSSNTAAAAAAAIPKASISWGDGVIKGL